MNDISDLLFHPQGVFKIADTMKYLLLKNSLMISATSISIPLNSEVVFYWRKIMFKRS